MLQQLKSYGAAPLALLVVVAAVAYWAWPRRVDVVRSIDEGHVWRADESPPRREVVWAPPAPISGLLDGEDAAVISPRLTDGGATLFFTVRRAGGQADIYRSRLSGGRWGKAEPLSEFNTAADEIGAAPSADGRDLYFYSNRPGGEGGFDLYVSHRKKGRWQAPRNLGPQVNTPAHEYDPAVSPDGLRLYFASNRTEAMARHAADKKTGGDKQWTATLRGDVGLRQFDLYVCARGKATADFGQAEPIAILNRDNSNEGAPFVSPNGAFLFFASDRASAASVEPGLDLYRSRLIGGAAAAPESLGKALNTLSNDTEPALSPEGFRLVFSSDRDGRDALYNSRATEVYHETTYNRANLNALKWVALPSLLVAAVLIGLLAALYHFREPLWERAAAAQFFAISLIIHFVVLVVMAFWSLPTVVELLVARMQDAEASSQPFDNNQHQSHEEGRQAWEKLADLQAPQATVDVVRRQTEAMNIPNESVELAPTISLAEARTLPADSVLYAPPAEQVEVRQRRAISSRPIAPADAPMEVAELEEAPPRAVAAAAFEAPMAMPRQDRSDTEAAPIEAPPNEPSQIAKARPVDFEPEQIEQSPEIRPLKNDSVERLAPDALTPMVELTDDAAAPAAPLPEEPAVAASASPKVERASATVSEAPSPAVDVDFAGRPALTPAAPIELDEEMEALSSPHLERTPTADSLAAAELAEADALDGEPLTPLPSGDPTVPNTQPKLSRSPAAALLETPASLEASGPQTGDRRIIVGELSEAANEAPPSLNPIASALDRPRAKATSVAYAEDNVGMREMFTLRQGDIRKKYIELFGGTDETEKAVNRGLGWLAEHQDPEGCWSLHQFHHNCKGKHKNCGGAGSTRSNAAATGLALLPFFAAGHTHESGDYQRQLSAALQWLAEIQKDNGELLAPGDHQRMYSHCIATIAVCEAYGMTADPNLKPMVEKALDFIVKAQHKGSGGWRYNPNESGDTSVVGWAVMALKSGEMAGIAIPPEVVDGAHRWLKRVEGNRNVGGMFGYQNRSPTPAMTAEGLLCLQFLGGRRNEARMLAGADYLRENLPTSKQSRTSYYWYYGTQVMYHMQGDYWEDWNNALRDHLVETQVKEDALAGTWQPKDKWERSGGRIYTTALKLLMLEVYFRHLPLYEQLEE